MHTRNVNDYSAKAKRSWDYQNINIYAVVSPLFVATNTIGLVVALWASGSGVLSIETVFVSFTYYALITRVMWQFNHIYRDVESALTEAAQFTDLLLEEPTLLDPVHHQKLMVDKGEVEFKEISFGYDESGGAHTFHNFSLRIAGGEKVALVGRSGSGKTTLTKLLQRFMDVDSGQILIDGIDISQIKQTDLRQVLAYVPQEPIMFHRSLDDNIRYGRQEASHAEVVAAAKVAYASEFIDKLDKSYETLVGERGIKLSGGQRQRVAIARAVLKNAPILVLDEATTSLDSESEAFIQDALWKLMEGRTALVVAHRLSTIQRMDRIVVLDEGKIMEEGAHNDLLKAQGLYAKLWNQQSGGFIQD